MGSSGRTLLNQATHRNVASPTDSLVFHGAETRAWIFNKGYGKIKFTCDAMTVMDPADTVVGFLIREEAV